MKFPSSFPILRFPVASGCQIIFLAMFLFTNIVSAQEKQAIPERRVFAHYMLCFAADVDFYKREIELAQRHGIEGFALNAGEWSTTDENNNYVAASSRMFQAAKELGTGFKLFFSADANGPGGRSANVADMVRRFANHPNQFHHMDRPVMSAWAGSPDSYKSPMEELKKEGIHPFFVPFVYPPKFPGNWSDQTVHRFFDGKDWMDGVFFFASDGTPAELIRTNATARKVTQELGKIYMAGVSPAYNSPNLRDFRGMEGYSGAWRGIIEDGADWVEIVTWSDYQEDSNLMPYRWSYPPMSEQYLFSRDEAFLDITAYYSMWFRTGTPPEIPQEKLYYNYRNRSKHLVKAWDYQNEKWIDIRDHGNKVDQIHDDVEDAIYVTTVLKEPAELIVESGGKEHAFQQGPGIVHVSVPMAAGVPRFTLRRGKKELLQVDGRKLIVGEATPENSPDGLHLSNRTWSGGAAVGNATELALSTATLANGATRGENGITIPTASGASLTVPTSKLKTGTYNIRIRYRNPAQNEARLTLTADGAAGGATTVPHHIPAFFPPTGEKSKTISFFWSLYDKTTALSLTCIIPPVPKDNAKKPHPLTADRGDVVIEAIELVAESPVAVPKPRSELPLMVKIPGGNFQMGSNKGAPDEMPIREVKVAPFAMAKYEVTNAEYEAFDPKHRQMRDDYSWRDGEPVIYVSWNDAVDYCNWLSKKAGLTPAYEEKTRKLLPDSDGYRLPSEAQWEYAASGRGESRTYPWGNDLPTSQHGHFALEQALSIDDALRGRGLRGVAPVGSYPLGASRDGVADLAGNVAEWCGDAHAEYAVETSDQPRELDADVRYRSIRGGSWGYYNFGQRVADREFNSPGYPGYIYIGFRVALPEAGWKKVEAK